MYMCECRLVTTLPGEQRTFGQWSSFALLAQTNVAKRYFHQTFHHTLNRVENFKLYISKKDSGIKLLS